MSDHPKILVPPLWINKIAEGTRLAEALNDMEEAGYEPVHIIHCGMKQLKTTNLIGGTDVVVVPIFMAAGRRLKRHFHMAGAQDDDA